MVGASPRPDRPSHGVMRYLRAAGFRVIPVNPAASGGIILGEPVLSSLADVPVPVEIVDIFRRSSEVGPVVDEAIRLKDRFGLLAVWMQLGVQDDAAAGRAIAAGLAVIMDRCIKIDHARLAAGSFDRP